MARPEVLDIESIKERVAGFARESWPYLQRSLKPRLLGHYLATPKLPSSWANGQIGQIGSIPLTALYLPQKGTRQISEKLNGPIYSAMVLEFPRGWGELPC